MIKRLLKLIFAVLMLGVAGLVLFYFWASSGKLPPEQRAEVRTYSETATPSSRADTTLVVMTYNIGYLSGLTNNEAVRETRSFFEGNLEDALGFLAEVDPDFIGFQEIDYHSKRSYYVDQVDTIAKRRGFGYAAVAINWDKRYVPYPYWPPRVHFGEMRSGQAVLSRYPIVKAERIVLAEVDAPFYYRAFYLDRLAQVVEVDVDGTTVVIINLHLEAFELQTRQRQAREVLDLLRSFAGRPVLLLGDFNSLPPHAAQKSGFEDEPGADFRGDETIALILGESGLLEAFPPQAYERDESLTHTFPSDRPTRRLDYIFYSPDRIEPVDWEVAHSAGTASDHLPVVFRFRLKAAD